MEDCKKPSTRELVKRLRYNNLLGLDENLRHGNLKGGKMNAEMLEMKRQFPHEVLLYRYCYNMQHCWHQLLMKFAGNHYTQSSLAKCNVLLFFSPAAIHTCSFCYLASSVCAFQC